MGRRVEGKKKKKGIKAKVTSKMGSKRKLSRMGKKQKAGVSIDNIVSNKRNRNHAKESPKKCQATKVQKSSKKNRGLKENSQIFGW